MNIFPRKEIDELKDNRKSLKFQITDFFIPESDRNIKDFDDYEFYSIYIYGTDDENITYCLKVINFKPFFYLKAPDNWYDLEDKEIISKLKNKLSTEKYITKAKKETNIIPYPLLKHMDKIEIVNKKDFWGFSNNKENRFIKISVKSLGLFDRLKYYFLSTIPKNEGFKLYESNIDPFLRFIHMKDIKPCSWISVKKYDINDNIPETICNRNITADWNDIMPLKINKIAPLLIASFDIECMSSHGDFPVAIKNYKKLAQDLCLLAKRGYDCKNLITNIKNAYINDVNIHDLKIHRLYTIRKLEKADLDEIEEKLKQNETQIRFYLNKMKKIEIEGEDDEDEEDYVENKKITTKEYNEIEDALNSYLASFLPKLEGDKIIQIGVSVHKFGNETIIYKKIITLNDCEEIEGIDVSCCKDEKELLKKWKNLMMDLNPDVVIGYNIWGFDIEYIWNRSIEIGINEKFQIGLGKICKRKCILKEQKLSSSALGDNIFNLLDVDGIVMIDLLKVIQKDFKLDSYKLDNVASIYIGDKKDDLKPKEIFEKFLGNAKDRSIIAKYCIQDCILVNRLLHKLKILENNIGMGNVCLVPLNFLFRRGQGIKIFSLVANECMRMDYLIPVIKNFIEDLDIEGYEGAIVLPPKEGIYLNDPIVVFDYGSLYPSSMICRNLSHDTYITDDKYLVENEDYEIIKVSYDLYQGLGDKKIKNGVKDCYFAKYKNGKKGIIPEILEMLLTERKNTRKKIEYSTVILKDGNELIGIIEDNDDHIIINSNKILKENILEIKKTYNKFECAVFDALQNAYKVTANSLYGQIGARTSPIYLKDIAACTTSTGREMILLAKDFVEKNYEADVIYGDTDSIFCKFRIKNEKGEDKYGKEALKGAINIGIDVEDKIKKFLPYPQKLNYEKCMYPFILFSKKRYVGNLYEKDDVNFKQKSMGIVLKRRDNANIVKKVYGGIIDIILNYQDLELSVKFLREELRKLVEGNMDINDLILSKTLRGFYKDPTKIAHKVLADRIGVREPGNKPAINERIQYIYIKNEEAKLQGDKIETLEFITQNKLKPDYLHYITNQIMKPVLQLYSLCLTELIDYKETDEYWEKVDEELRKKEMYKDDTRRNNRLESLRLLKVKELLFDEFIDLLKEPKVKKERAKKEVIEIVEEEVELKECEYEGEMKVIESKVKECITYKIVIKDKSGKVIYKDDGNTKDLNKEKIILSKLKEIYNKMNGTTKIKINYKKFVKDYKLLIAKYKYINKQEKINKTDVGIAKIIGELMSNKELLELKDKIILED
jgi:DNA polymerase elongation subunit (family B)